MKQIVQLHKKKRGSGTRSLSARVSQMCGELGASLQARRIQQNHADDAHVQLSNLEFLFICILKRQTDLNIYIYI